MTQPNTKADKALLLVLAAYDAVIQRTNAERNKLSYAEEALRTLAAQLEADPAIPVDAALILQDEANRLREQRHQWSQARDAVLGHNKSLADQLQEASHAPSD